MQRPLPALVPAPAPAADPLAALRALEPAVFARAAARDADRAFPAEDVAALAEAGLIAAPLPGAGGLGLDPATADDARAVLTLVGRASLTVGRLYEGHMNAVKLCHLHGGAAAQGIVAAEARAGRLSAVWNAERGEGLRAERAPGGWRLRGAKIHCSGAGSIRRPVVTARTPDGPLMLLPDMAAAGIAVDLAVWRASGMRATATATVAFDGVHVPDAAVVGAAGDYYRAPWFSGGAWRVLAVQLGGVQAAQRLHADALARRGADPVARARLADAAGCAELARLLVAEAAIRAERRGDAAYVDLARTAFERLALDVLAAARRGANLAAFIAPDPLDRVGRDLETYLRQPMLDASRDAAAGALLDGRLSVEGG